MIGIGCNLISFSTFSVVASGDFTNIASANAADGVYTLNGVSCTLTDIINLSGPDSGLFNPATDIDAGGVFCPSGTTRIFNIGNPLLSETLAGGYSITLDFGFSTGITVGTFMHPDNYAFQPEIDAIYTSAESKQLALANVSGASSSDIINTPEPGTNRLAATMAADYMSVSINGSPITRLEGAALDPLLTAIAFSMSSDENDGRLIGFAFYEVVADADLPTLSAL